MGDDAVAAIVDRIRRVPDAYRRFDQDEATALRVFRLDQQLLAEAVGHGLPFRSSDDGLRYDELDLTNLSLSLRLPSPRYLAMHQWPAAIRAAASPEAMHYEVDISARCSAPDTGHVCDARLADPLREAGARLDARTRKGSLTVAYAADTPSGSAPPELGELFDELDDLHFHVLPIELYGDVEFAKATSLANCELASRLLVQRGRESGWDTRRSFGLLLSTPFSIPHFWAEFRLEDRWVAFDPHTITSLRRWGLLDPSTCRNQAVNAAVLRVGEEWVDLIEDQGRPVTESLLTRRRFLADTRAEGSRA